MSDLAYLHGLGNAHATEAEPGALPRDQNTPQHAPYGLYAEQINGTGFTVERALNRRTWMYRLRPQVTPRPWEPLAHPRFVGTFEEAVPSPQILRFRPLPAPPPETDWIDGLTTFAGAGEPSTRAGAGIHLYAANRSMDRSFVSLDGELLIAPTRGSLRVRTELGLLDVGPGEIALLPRGIRFQVLLHDALATGFVAQPYAGHLQLPERGVVGANGLADARHFRIPVAAYVNEATPHEVVLQNGGRLWRATQDHSPYDVVAWHGNHVPAVYDLSLFSSLWTVNVDHADPSILTVLTCPYDTHGRSVLDVAVFRGRWDPTEHTFRPPFLHRNAAVEFNGVVKSDATGGPWQTGAFSWTPYLQTHGVSAHSVESELARTDDAPERRPDSSLWIQFESTFPMKVLPWMLDHPARDADYLRSFDGYPEGELARRGRS